MMYAFMCVYSKPHLVLMYRCNFSAFSHSLFSLLALFIFFSTYTIRFPFIIIIINSPLLAVVKANNNRRCDAQRKIGIIFIIITLLKRNSNFTMRTLALIRLHNFPIRFFPANNSLDACSIVRSSHNERID